MNYDNIQTFIREMHSSLDSIQELIVEKYLDEDLKLNDESIKELRNLYTDEIGILNLIISKLQPNKKPIQDNELDSNYNDLSNSINPEINLKYHLFDKLFIKGYVSDHNDKLNLQEWSNISGVVKLYWCGNLKLNVNGREYLIVGIRTDFCWKFLLFDITFDDKYYKYVTDILLSITHPSEENEDVKKIYNDSTTFAFHSLQGYIQKKISKLKPIQWCTEIYFLNPKAESVDDEKDEKYSKARAMEEYYFNSISKSFDSAMQRGQGCNIYPAPPVPVPKIDISKFSFTIAGQNEIKDGDDILVYKWNDFASPEVSITLFASRSKSRFMLVRHFMRQKHFAIIQCRLQNRNEDTHTDKKFIIIASRFSELCLQLKELRTKANSMVSSEEPTALYSDLFYALMKSDNTEMFEIYNTNSRSNSHPALIELLNLIKFSNNLNTAIPKDLENKMFDEMKLPDDHPLRALTEWYTIISRNLE